MTTTVERTLQMFPLIALCGAALAQPGGPALTVETVTATDSVHAGETAEAAVLVTLPEGWHVNAHMPLDGFLIPTSLSIDEPAGLTVLETVYPEPEEFRFTFSDDVVLAYSGTFTIGVAIAVPADLSPGDFAVKGVLRYQACTDTACFAPTSHDIAIVPKVVPASQPLTRQRADVFDAIAFAGPAVAVPPTEPDRPAPEAQHPSQAAGIPLLREFAIAGQAGGYMRPGAFIEFIDAAESGEGVTPVDFLRRRSAWAVLIVTLLGGLLLNLTPCVLPMLPINLGIIGAGAQSGIRFRGLVLGALYGLGIALTYGVLGLIVVLTAGAFGGLNATPWFNFAVCVVFVALGLAMFDVLVIDLSKFQGKARPKNMAPGGLFLAFFLGFINALLAGACVAPVVIAVILYSQDAYAKGSALGLALPFVLGIGMAAPWPLAGAGLAFLPKPGAWMIRVKQVFGVLILLVAAYYGYQGAMLFNDRYLVDPVAVRDSAQAADQEGWMSSLSEGLELAKKGNRPVIIDFWATWCKNCLTMNKTTLKDPGVQKRLADYVKIKYQAEIPDHSPAKDVLAHFDYVGLPHYVILKPVQSKT